MVGTGFISPYWVFFSTLTHIAGSIQWGSKPNGVNLLAKLNSTSSEHQWVRGSNPHMGRHYIAMTWEEPGNQVTSHPDVMSEVF